MDNCQYFCDKCLHMKKAHKSKNPGAYATEPDEPRAVAEPGVAYYAAPYNDAARAIGLMGMEGKKGFTHVKNDSDFIDIIRTGIPKQAMTNLMDVMDLSLNEMALIIHTSDRTLRRYTPAQKLSQEQSERMIEIAKLYSKGEEVFGSLDSFRQWMATALLSFGNRRPKDFLDTSIGINMLTEELGRIENGIFA